MSKCLYRYQWVKLPRNSTDLGKGTLGYWFKLASRAAFRKGTARYCQHTNEVTPGTWAGGVVGLKSILGVRSRQKALEIMARHPDFDIVNNPLMTVSVLHTVTNSYQIINRADIGGYYLGQWQTATTTWITITKKLTPDPELPRTGY